MQKKNAPVRSVAELQSGADVPPGNWLAAQPRVTPEALDLPQLLLQLLRFGQSGLGYVATINVAQLLDYYRDPIERSYYRHAAWIVAANHTCARLISWLKGRRPVVSSSTTVFESVLERVYTTDRVVFLGGTPQDVTQCSGRFGLTDVRHSIAPPSSQHMEDCLRFVEQSSPFRFCFLAADLPLRERIVLTLRTRARARGLIFCLGNSVPQR